MTTEINFHIVETDWTKEFNMKYSQIKQDYLNGLRIMDIKQKYGLTDGRWYTFRKQLIKDGVMTSTSNKPKPKYYSSYRGGFVVQKVINRKKYHIGAFKTEAEAKECVRLMEEINWDLTQKYEIIQKVRTNVKK